MYEVKVSYSWYSKRSKVTPDVKEEESFETWDEVMEYVEEEIAHIKNTMSSDDTIPVDFSVSICG